VKIQEMVYRFKLGAQRVDTKSAPGLKVPQIIMYLNGGMNNLLMQRYGPHNSYQSTLEAIQKRIDEWQRLIIPHEELSSNNDESEKGIYTFSLLETKQKYLFLLRIACYGSQGNCSKQKLNMFFSPSNNLEADLDNPNANPNFGWRESLHRIAQDKILAYSDKTFSIDTADIDYLRYPKALDITGYKHFDGEASVNADCELPEFLHEDIIKQAVIDFELSEKHPGVESSMTRKSMEE
jgi:hypothetical protein